MPTTNRAAVYPTTGSTAGSNPPSAPLSDYAFAHGVTAMLVMSLITVAMATSYWFASYDWRNVALAAAVYPYSTVVLVGHWDKRRQRDESSSSSEEPWAGGCLRVSPEVRLVVVAGIMFSLAFTLAGRVLRPDWFDWAVIVIGAVVHTALLARGIHRVMAKAFQQERRQQERRQQALELV